MRDWYAFATKHHLKKIGLHPLTKSPEFSFVYVIINLHKHDQTLALNKTGHPLRPAIQIPEYTHLKYLTSTLLVILEVHIHLQLTDVKYWFIFSVNENLCFISFV